MTDLLKKGQAWKILGLMILLPLSSTSDAAQPIRAGIYQNPPKIYQDDNGIPRGFFVDLINSIADSEGWKIEYVPCEWNACLQQLETGDIDLMADVAYSSEREKRFDFGREVVFASWSVIYAKPGSNIESIPDLHNKSVVVLKDSIQFSALQELAESFAVSPRFIEVTSFNQGYELVENGAADCIAVNRFIGKQRESDFNVQATNILIAPAFVNFAASRADQRNLLDSIDRQLVKLKQNSNSSFYQAFDKWFDPERPAPIPIWLKWVLGSIAIVILILMILNTVLRRIVRHKTSELETNKDFLERLSFFDSLTGLPNRVLFVDRLELALRKTGIRSPQMAVIFIDLDGFKEINDSLGHDIGDEVLKIVANRFAACVREKDTVARLGGDEFTVLLDSPKHAKHDSVAVAEKILNGLRQPIKIQDHVFYLSASVGISLSKQDGNEAQELLRNADIAMYRAKQDGRNTIRFYTQEMTQNAVARIKLTTGIREGVDNGEFLLHYQPLFDLEATQIVGVEALVRWNRGSDGLVSPAAFIPVAEESGLIYAIGEHVLNEACVQMSRWKQAGIAPPRIAVNLSGKQVQRGDIVGIVENALQQSGCEASWLELEVSEDFIMNTPDISISLMQALRDMGVELSIDDFGTGYSSLAYLKTLPISKLKIDQSFVRDIPADKDDMAIARSILALGNSLGLTVLAEGIETEEQLDFLKQEGCRFGQGFLLGRPMPAEEITDLLTESRSTGNLLLNMS